MKSEHRHDLQTNDLARLAKKVGEVLQKNGIPLLIGACAVAVAAITALILANQSRTQNELGWRRFATSANAEDLAKVADDYEGTAVAAWARLKEAEANLQQGVQVAFTDRPGEIAEVSELKQAKEGFDKLLDGSSVPSTVRERALIGMARYLETTCDGDTEKAIGAYRTFISEFPDAPQAKFAEQRIQALERAETKDFYAWFFKQRPKPKPKDTQPDVGGLDVGQEQSSSGSETAGQPAVSETTSNTAQSGKQNLSPTGDGTTPADAPESSTADGSAGSGNADSKDESAPSALKATDKPLAPEQKAGTDKTPTTPTPDSSESGDVKSGNGTAAKGDAGSK